MEASVNEMAGGESTMMCANLSDKVFRSLRISSEPSNSAGFGGTGPDVKSFRFGISAWSCKTSSMEHSPERKLVSPRVFDKLKFACIRGRLRSQSMIRTSAPVWASMNAVFTAVVVFPSEGWLEVTRIVRGGLPADDSSSDVRRWR